MSPPAPPPPRPDRPSAIGLATAAALAMIAYQVGAKSTRNALFLSTFPYSALPAMTIATAVLSIAMAFVAARALARFGPRRLIPLGFFGSALLLVGEWVLIGIWPRGAVVAVYLHYGAIGALLISGFWSFLNERFDPRSAKRAIGRIAAGGTVGGLLGGVLAERVGSAAPIATMLPVLAGIHGLCGALVLAFDRAAAAPAPDRRLDASGSGGNEPPRSGLRVLARSSYLRSLLALVLLLGVSEALVDWVFNARVATSMTHGPQLLRFFAVFYTGVSLLTVVLQGAFSRVALERIGLARSVAALPAAVGVGSLGAAIWPGLPSALGLRATESLLSNSIYRAGYESLFTAVSAPEKRAVKPIVDVGAARGGELAGAGLVQTALWGSGLAYAPLVALILAATACTAALAVALRLQRGYVRALERGLVSRAIHLDLSEARDAVTRSLILRSLGGHPLSSVVGRVSPAAAPAGPGASPTPAGVASDPPTTRWAAMASGRRDLVRRALAEGPLTAELMGQAIALLAWDEVARDAIAALRNAGEAALDPLAASFRSEQTDFTIRRRIPLVLATMPDARAVGSLLDGLADRRFEIRYRCGRGLYQLLDGHPRLGVPPDAVMAAVLREVRTERRVWDGQRVLEQWDDDAWSPLQDETLRTRANRSLEHVFTLLSLVLPRQPVRIAYRGLQHSDALLRGTALEYLEWALPEAVRKELWPYLDDDPKRKRRAHSPAEALDELQRFHATVVVRLDRARAESLGEGPPAPPTGPA